MSQISEYTSEEVETLCRVPLAVGMMVVGASLSGPVGIVKELLAARQAIKEASKQAPENSVLHTLFSEANMKAQNEQMSHEKPQAMDKAKQMGKIRQAISILSNKGETSEVADYKALLIKAAENTANAAKEGGFLGIGGKRVTEEEQAVITEIRSLVGS